MVAYGQQPVFAELLLLLGLAFFSFVVLPPLSLQPVSFQESPIVWFVYQRLVQRLVQQQIQLQHAFAFS